MMSGCTKMRLGTFPLNPETRANEEGDPGAAAKKKYKLSKPNKLMVPVASVIEKITRPLT